MIKYTCVICEKLYPFDDIHLIDDNLVCNTCQWKALWKNHKDPRQPVLNLIDSLQAEVGHASHGEPYATIYSAMDVHEILNEIQQSVEDMEV